VDLGISLLSSAGKVSRSVQFKPWLVALLSTPRAASTNTAQNKASHLV